MHPSRAFKVVQAVVLLGFLGCAVGTSVDPDESAIDGGGSDSGTKADVVRPDGGPVVTPDGGGTDATPPNGDGGPCNEGLVINEVQALSDTSANDEFVEIYNPTACEVSLSGWSIKYSSGSGGSGGDVLVGTSSHKVPALGYFVIASGSFSGPSDDTYTGGKMGADGQVGLFNGSSKVDAVGWGTIKPADYVHVEGSPAAAPNGNQSVQRIPNGKDSNSNSADFKAASPTPKARN